MALGRSPLINALSPNVERRLSSVCTVLSVFRRLTPDSRHARNTRSGMTMIELSLVMGIVTLLLALVIGLSRHVNETVKLRRAQADLGIWHETLSRWHLQFGEYPYASIDETGEADSLLNEERPERNLSNVFTNASFELTFNNGSAQTNIHFRSLITANVKLTDPWGIPYIYDCDEGGQSYILYSCGPDARSTLHKRTVPSTASGSANTPDPTLDDIYFER